MTTKREKFRCDHCHHARRHYDVYEFYGQTLCYHHFKWAELNSVKAYAARRSLPTRDTDPCA